MIYTFTDTDRSLALEAAERVRELEAAGLVVQDAQIAEAINAGNMPLDNFTAHYRGCLAEIAVAVVTDLEWGGHWAGGIDVLPNVEVKSVTRSYWGPYLRPADLDDDRVYTLVAAYLEDDQTCMILGWCRLLNGYVKAQDCAQRNYQHCCKHYKDTGNVRINRRHLRPITTLNPEAYQ